MNVFEEELDAIMKIEQGDYKSIEEYTECFRTLLAHGTIWHLQGSYQRALKNLVIEGLIDASEAIPPKAKKTVCIKNPVDSTGHVPVWLK